MRILKPKNQMKKPSHRDLALLAIALLIGALIGWSIRAIYDNCKQPISIENPTNEALKKRGDSLEAVIIQRDLIISNNSKQQAIHDSIIVNNNKTLKKDYDKIKNLDDSTRAMYIDSILKRANIRR